MYEFVPTHKRTVFVSDCDPTPKMPFTPYKLRREHPELLPKVNVATTYEKYFDEIQAFSDDYGKSIWHVTFERRSPRVIDLERHSQIMAEVMNSFNRSRSGRALNITGCRLQNIRARNADFFFESWTFVVGKAAALMVASKFLDLHHVRLGGCEVQISYHHSNPPRRTEATYKDLWDRAFLSRERWLFVRCERIGGSFELTLHCRSLPLLGELQRLWNFFDDIIYMYFPRFDLTVGHGCDPHPAGFDKGLCAAFLPFKYMPFARFGDLYRARRKVKDIDLADFKIKRSKPVK